MNASFYPEMTDLLGKVCDDIAMNIIKEGKPIWLIDEYSWYREVLSLLSKQVNLCDSCLLLLENGMEQEAYLLARSQFNNILWIKYICDGQDESRLKEYFYQENINQIKTAEKMKKLVRENSDKLDDRFDKNMIGILDEKIKEHKQILSKDDMRFNQKNVAELSKQSPELFSLYITLYNEGSKFEHSDISKTKLYRKQVIEGYDKQIFTFDLSSSNRELWMTVYEFSLSSLFFAFESFRKRIFDREDQLFSTVYKKDDFKTILLNLYMCREMLDKYNFSKNNTEY